MHLRINMYVEQREDLARKMALTRCVLRIAIQRYSHFVGKCSYGYAELNGMEFRLSNPSMFVQQYLETQTISDDGRIAGHDVNSLSGKTSISVGFQDRRTVDVLVRIKNILS